MIGNRLPCLLQAERELVGDDGAETVTVEDDGLVEIVRHRLVRVIHHLVDAAGRHERVGSPPLDGLVDDGICLRLIRKRELVGPDPGSGKTEDRGRPVSRRPAFPACRAFLRPARRKAEGIVFRPVPVKRRNVRQRRRRLSKPRGDDSRDRLAIGLDEVMVARHLRQVVAAGRVSTPGVHRLGRGKQIVLCRQTGDRRGQTRPHPERAAVLDDRPEVSAKHREHRLSQLVVLDERARAAEADQPQNVKEGAVFLLVHDRRVVQMRGHASGGEEVRRDPAVRLLQPLRDFVHHDRAHAVTEERKRAIQEREHLRDDGVRGRRNALDVSLVDPLAATGQVDRHHIDPVRNRLGPAVVDGRPASGIREAEEPHPGVIARRTPDEP